MRTLKFIVDNLIVTKDPDCNFDNLVPGTEGYLKAEFSFSPDWTGYKKVASFKSVMGVEYPPQVLKDGKTCLIPAEALKKRVIVIKVLGKKGDSMLVTNEVSVKQSGGNK